MTQTVTGLYDSYADAKAAVERLEAAGVPHADISIVASNARGEHMDVVGRDGATARGAETGRSDAVAAHAADDAGKGAGMGAAVGGVGGLLAGLGLLAIPGVGPVVAAGWLAATAVGALGGAAIGAAAGGLVGALTEAGVPERDAQVYAEGVRRGGSLVTAKVDDNLAAAARQVLSGDRAIDLDTRRDAYLQSGWSRFDANAPAYTADEVAAERARYDRAI